MIIKRGSKYCVRVYSAGRQVWVGTFEKLGDARAAERQAQTRPHPHFNESVADYIERWKRQHPRERASTNRHNGYMVKSFATEFGAWRMSDISKRDARDFAAHHRASVSVVRAMFNDALREEVVVSNPFADMRLPQSRGRKDLVVLSSAEVRELADVALDFFDDYGPVFRACVLFAAWVGLRPAELFVLTWDDVEGDELVISKSLGSTGDVTRPKNGKVRRVLLPPQARAALAEMPRRVGTPYIFTTSTGQRFSKTSHYYYWNRLRGVAGRKDMDFYELRHFAATWLLEQGASDADVAIQLGHTDGGALVRSTYGHPSEDAARARLRGIYASERPALRVLPTPPPDSSRNAA